MQDESRLLNFCLDEGVPFKALAEKLAGDDKVTQYELTSKKEGKWHFVQMDAVPFGSVRFHIELVQPSDLESLIIPMNENILHRGISGEAAGGDGFLRPRPTSSTGNGAQSHQEIRTLLKSLPNGVRSFTFEERESFYL